MGVCGQGVAGTVVNGWALVPVFGFPFTTVQHKGCSSMFVSVFGFWRILAMEFAVLEFVIKVIYSVVKVEMEIFRKASYWEPLNQPTRVGF